MQLTPDLVQRLAHGPEDAFRPPAFGLGRLGCLGVLPLYAVLSVIS
jgi:hypothetical protein